jgi:hypothetical protein
MKYFVHLKDDVVFAFHESSTEVDIPGDNIIEVDHDGRDFLKKKYVNGSFIDAPEIKYVKLDSSNTVISVEKTVFASDVKDGWEIVDNLDVDVLWKKVGNSFVAPTTIKPIDTETVGDVVKTISDSIPSVSEEELAARIAAQEAAEAERIANLQE